MVFLLSLSGYRLAPTHLRVASSAGTPGTASTTSNDLHMVISPFVWNYGGMNDGRSPTRDVHFNCPVDLYREARIFSVRSDVTFTNVLVSALTEYLARNSPDDGR